VVEQGLTVDYGDLVGLQAGALLDLRLLHVDGSDSLWQEVDGSARGGHVNLGEWDHLTPALLGNHREALLGKHLLLMLDAGLSWMHCDDVAGRHWRVRQGDGVGHHLVLRHYGHGLRGGRH